MTNGKEHHLSTKCTIGHGKTHHLYEECFDPDRVYLRLEGDAVNTEVDLRASNNRVTLGIDVGVWRQIVDAWVKSPWGQHPERDYEREPLTEDHFEALDQLLGAKKP
jgi:hypothetical protein